MSYKICKNKLNDFTYITFGNIKAQVINATNDLESINDELDELNDQLEG